MFLASAIALWAQFNPYSFPDNKMMIACCCFVFFTLQGFLYILDTYIIANHVVMQALPDGNNSKWPSDFHNGVKVATTLKRYDDNYTITMTTLSSSSISESINCSVGKYFDSDGWLVDKNLRSDMQKLVTTLVSKCEKKKQ